MDCPKLHSDFPLGLALRNCRSGSGITQRCRDCLKIHMTTEIVPSSGHFSRCGWPGRHTSGSRSDKRSGILPLSIDMLEARKSEPLVPSAPGGSGLRATQSNTICPLHRILRQPLNRLATVPACRGIPPEPRVLRGARGTLILAYGQ